MHLSLHTGGFLSGRRGNADQPLQLAACGRAHREGLIRGLLFMAAIAIPFCLAVATGHGVHHDPSGGYAQAFAEQP